MAGKDIEIGTNPISRGVCEILGSTPPVTWMYEMFLAADGSKISKTKNNGISLDQMLRYLPPSAIRHFMFLSPESAKRLDLSKIPRYLDDFITDLLTFKESTTALLENPIFYSRNQDLPSPNLTGSMVLSLIRGLNFDNFTKLEAHLMKMIPNFNEVDAEILTGMYRFYYEEYEKPNFVPLSQPLQGYLVQFLDYISENGDEMQQHLYRLGNDAVNAEAVKDLKTWFQAIYQALLGQTQGRRLGAFFAVCGPERTRELITNACNGVAQ
jgi:lysyl-tRNA synthetase class 1